MIVDDIKRMKAIDQSDMLREIQTLPEQLQNAWEFAEKYPLPKLKDLQMVTIAGMGGSAIGADILAGYVADICSIPVSVIRGYSLPDWVSGSGNLVVCSSHSGNTEETLSVFNQAIDQNCTVMAVSTGGKLAEMAGDQNIPFWQFDHLGQPRSAVGYSFGLLLNLFSRLNLIPGQADEIQSAVEGMQKTIDEIDSEIPVAKNLAKRIAGQAYGRQPVVLSAEHLESIARRWKTQINEIAKAWAGFEFLPEADHNTLAGLEYAEPVLNKIYAIFLASGSYHPRNQKRMNLTSDQFMIAGLCTDKVIIEEKKKLAEIWRYLILGDYISYYLAMMYKVDPTPIESLESFKKAMEG